MSKKDKLFQKIKNNPKNVKFEILKKLLEECGYKGINNGGSHWVFTKENAPSITIPFKKPIKVIYVKHTITILQEQGCMDD